MSETSNGGEPVVHQHDTPTVPTIAAGGTHWMPPSEPSIVLSAPSLPPRRRNSRAAAAGIGAVAVLLAGAFAVRAATADDGGAESPTAAAQAFFDALAAEDIIGAMDMVLPGEQATFRDPFVEVVGELRRLEVASPEADASAVSGIDIEFPELAFTERPTNVDDITGVEVDGSATIEIDGRALPFGDLLLDAIGGTDRLDEADTISGEDAIEDYVFATVRQDGRWYVSLGYTVAERARWGGGDPMSGPDIPSASAAVQPRGGDTPEEGMDVLFDSIEDLDLEGMIGVLDPREFDALHRYAPLFLDDAQRELDAAVDEVGDVTISIDDREYAVEQDGSRAHVTLSAATISVAADGMEVEIEYGDGCLKVSGSDMETESFCSDDVASGTEDIGALGEFGLPTEELTALGEVVTEAFADVGNVGIAMTRVDGSWYISPFATMSDTVLAVMRALDRSEIEDIADAGRAVVDAFFESFSGMGPGLDDFGTEGGTDGGTGPDSFDAYNACLAETDVDARAACLQIGIDTGVIESYMVTVQELYPACGLAVHYDNGFSDYSGLSDEEFISLMTDARDCFQGLIDTGEIDEFQMPTELADVSCYEGRNPEAIEDFDERVDVQGQVFDCLLAAG